MNSSNQWFFRL